LRSFKKKEKRKKEEEKMDSSIFPLLFEKGKAAKARQLCMQQRWRWYSFQKLKAQPKPSKSETNDNALYRGAITVMNFINYSLHPII